jgi:hypothetical protein
VAKLGHAAALVAIDEIAACEGVQPLLLHVYEKHPPCKPTLTLERLRGVSPEVVGEWKKVLLKAQRDYHPDRNSLASLGLAAPPGQYPAAPLKKSVSFYSDEGTGSPVSDAWASTLFDNLGDGESPEGSGGGLVKAHLWVQAEEVESARLDAQVDAMQERLEKRRASKKADVGGSSRRRHSREGGGSSGGKAGSSSPHANTSSKEGGGADAADERLTREREEWARLHEATCLHISQHLNMKHDALYRPQMTYSSGSGEPVDLGP